MAYEVLSADGVVFSVWGETLVEDVAAVLEHVRAVVRECGHPIVYITRVPLDAPAPDAKVRSYINTIMPELTDLCSSYHVILEGGGLASAIKRGVLMGLFQVRRRRNMFHVHAEASEVAEQVALDRRDAVCALLKQADARGILHGPLPT